MKELLTDIQIEIHNCEFRCFAISKNGKLIAAGNSIGEITIYDSENFKVLNHFKAHTRVVKTIIFIEDDKKLLSSGFDKEIKLWDCNSLELITKFSASVSSYSKSNNNGTFFVSELFNGGSYTINLEQLNFSNAHISEKEIGESLAEVWALDFYDNNLLFWGNLVGELTCYDITAMKVDYKINLGGRIQFIKISSDGKFVVISCASNILILNVNSKSLSDRLEYYESFSTLAITKNSNFIAGATYKGNIILYDIGNKVIIGKGKVGKYVRNIIFHPISGNLFGIGDNNIWKFNQ